MFRTEEEKFYWFGFLLTTAKPLNKAIWYNKYNKYFTEVRAIVIKLPVKYCKHLTKLAKLFNEPVKTISSKTTTSCRLTIHSADFVQLLQDNNITTAAGFGSTPLDLSNPQHFWRGYFDANGNIYAGKTIVVTGSSEICTKFLEFLVSNGLKTKVKPIKKARSYQLKLQGRKLVSKVIDILYNNATVYLEN